MHTQGHKEKELTMKLNVEGLTPTQIRLIKSIHSLLANVVSSEDEAEYFEMSAELMKKAAEVIKNSQFALDHKEMAYGNQAVEFAVDSLNEQMEDGLNNFDN